MADRTTQELRVEAVRRELAAQERARSAEEPAEQHEEERRADKAAYLREKLTERVRAEERR